MKFIIKNLKNVPHTICREFGVLVDIPANSYILIDTESEREISVWKKMSQEKLQSYGIEVIFNEQEVMKIISNNGSSITTDASIIDGFVSPIAREIASVTSSTSNEPDTLGNIEESKDGYNEEDLLSMDKEDLFNICDNFNVKYKRNNSVKTLVKLLKDAGVVQS